jgi:hypothetical protein
MAKVIITKNYLHELFEYREGKLYWKVDRTNKTKAGMLVGSFGEYNTVCLNRKKIGVHRIIFMMFHGYMPDYIDHIDRNTLNNKIENLRPATNTTNQYNAKISKNNTSGYKNVSWDKACNKWKVALRADKKSVLIGHFGDLDLAGLVAKEARIKYHGEFARHE